MSPSELIDTLNRATPKSGPRKPGVRTIAACDVWKALSGDDQRLFYAAMAWEREHDRCTAESNYPTILASMEEIEQIRLELLAKDAAKAAEKAKA